MNDHTASLGRILSLACRRDGLGFRQSRFRGMSDERAARDLETYLRDHYAGAVGAIELLEHLEKAHAEEADGAFFRELRGAVAADQEQLHNLMSALGFEESGARNAAAWVADKLGRVKLGFSAGPEASLRLLQSLETLHLGITGKRSLWRALEAAAEASPILAQTDFAVLEKRANDQLERLEAKRLEVARATFRAG